MSAIASQVAEAAELSLRARELSGRLTKDALAREQRNQVPAAEVGQLRGLGLLTAPVPRDLGGSGLRWSELMELVHAVAAGDTSIAQLLGYHYLIVVSALAGARPEQRESLARGTIEDGWYWGGAVNPLDPGVVLHREGRGYRLEGFKTFATGCTVADILFVNASLDGRPRIVLVPALRPGVQIERGSWDNLGVRLSETGTVRFSEVEASAADLLGPEVPSATPSATSIPRVGPGSTRGSRAPPRIRTRSSASVRWRASCGPRRP